MIPFIRNNRRSSAAIFFVNKVKEMIDKRKNTKFSKITCAFPKCNFPNSSGFWIFRLNSVLMQGTEKTCNKMSLYRKKLSRDAFMRKNRRIVLE